MKRLLTHWFDKASNRLALTILARTDERLLHPNRLLLEEARRESADYAKARMQDAVVLKDQAEVLEFALSRRSEHGLVLEFGVGAGTSIRRIAAVGGPVHGFDSFTGLPEDWGGRHEGKGHYSNAGRPPAVPANVTLHIGTFAETLPGFLAANPDPVAFVHVDCDLYTSTRTVLDLLGDRLVAGSVVVFDEYFNYPSWQRHEFKAFQEFVAARRIAYRYLCWGYQQAAVMIERKGAITP